MKNRAGFNGEFRRASCLESLELQFSPLAASQNWLLLKKPSKKENSNFYVMSGFLSPQRSCTMSELCEYWLGTWRKTWRECIRYLKNWLPNDFQITFFSENNNKELWSLFGAYECCEREMIVLVSVCSSVPDMDAEVKANSEWEQFLFVLEALCNFSLLLEWVSFG